MNDKLSEVLNMEEDAAEGEILPRASFSNTLGGDGKADADFKYTRDNLYNLVESGMRALESLVDVTTHSPALAAQHAFHTIQEGYWSATTSLYEPRYAWVLYTKDGAIGVGYKPQQDFYLLAIR